MRGKFFQRLWGRRGQALVEFALILPLLLLVILGVIEFGRIFYGFSTLQNAARYAADVASKAPPHLGDPVPDDPEGRRYAVDPPDCGQPGKDACYLAAIREAVRRYAVLFTPRDPHIHVYFVPIPPDNNVTNAVGGVVEVEIEYPILPITPVIKDMAPLGVPVKVDSRRTIINVEFPYEVATPLGTPWPTPGPTGTPVPGCGGKYTWQEEKVEGKKYRFTVTNNDTRDRGIVGLIVGWCADLGNLESLTIGGVEMLGGPVPPPGVSVPGGWVAIGAGQTMAVEMRFEKTLNQLDPSQWPSWHLTFDDYCWLTSGSRNCPYPTPTQLPTLTPTSTPPPTSSPTPWPSGTPPAVCGMYISNGPIFAGDRVQIELTNGGYMDANLDTIVVMWGPNWPVAIPLKEADWDGVPVWTGTKYYSAKLEGLSGGFPAGATRNLEFLFDASPVNWLTFQAAFDNGCFVSYTDPNQPTPPPLPTATPTPLPVHVELATFSYGPDPQCADKYVNAWAIAWDPAVCGASCSDGQGIDRVYFRITNPGGQLVYESYDTSVCYCGKLGNCTCPNVDFSSGDWVSGAGTFPVSSGTHVLTVRAQSVLLGRTAEIAQDFQVCWNPCTPYTFVSKTRSPSNTRRVIVRIKNNSTTKQLLTDLIHVESWPTAWGTLDTITVFGNPHPAGAPWPPAPFDLACQHWLGKGQEGQVWFTFQNTVPPSDVSLLTGYIKLDNTCQISY